MVNEANNELHKIIEKLKEIKSRIEDSTTHLHLVTSERPIPPMYEFGYKGYCLCFNNREPFQYNIKRGVLIVSLYEKSGHNHFDYEEKLHKQALYQFDRDLVGNNRWLNLKKAKEFFTTDELIDKWVKQFVTNMEKRRKTKQKNNRR